MDDRIWKVLICLGVVFAAIYFVYVIVYSDRVLAAYAVAMSESAVVRVIPTETFTPVRIGAPVQQGTTGAVVFIDADGDGIEETYPVHFWCGEQLVDRVYRQEWPFPGWQRNKEGE